MTKQIPLGNDRYALVDADKYDYLMQWKWHFDGKRYAKCSLYLRNENGKSINNNFYMHKLLMPVEKGLNVDHINGDPLDNRLSNLRTCTPAENARNTVYKKPNCYSKYRGVTFHIRGKRWSAKISFNNKRIHLGCFDCQEAAAKAYNEAALKYHGEFASLNQFN